jgi:hypothetical protein
MYIFGSRGADSVVFSVETIAERDTLPVPFLGVVFVIETGSLYYWDTAAIAWLPTNSSVGAFQINGLDDAVHSILFEQPYYVADEAERIALISPYPAMVFQKDTLSLYRYNDIFADWELLRSGVTENTILSIRNTSETQAQHWLILPDITAGTDRGLITKDLYELLELLGDTEHEYEVFTLITSGVTGNVGKPEHGTIVFGQYEDAGDCLVVKVDSNGRPVDEPARDSDGNIVTGAFTSADGDFVLDRTPAEFPVSIIWQLRIAEKYKTAEIDQSRVVNETEIISAQKTTFNDSVSLTGRASVQAVIDYIRTIPINYHGVVVLPTYNRNVDGTLDIGAGVANFYTTADGNSVCVRKITPAATALSFPDFLVSYVYANYSGGSPIIEITQSPATFEADGRLVPIFRVSRVGTKLSVMNYDEYGVALADKHYFKDIVLRGAERFSGLVLSTAATRISTVSQGMTYFGVTRTMHAENKAGATGELCEFYKTAGVWQKDDVTAYDSTYYCDGTTRQTLNNNKWVAKYFFRFAGEDNLVSYIHGNQYNTRLEAENELKPIAPEVVEASSIYVGKIVIQKNAVNGFALPRIWGQAVSASGAVDHNDLANRDAAGNHTKIVPLADSVTAFQVTKADGTTVMLNADTTNDVLQTEITNYENNVTADNDIPNKKYVDNSAIKYAIALG